MANEIKWYDNKQFDAPELKSPQPCIHGKGCVYTVKDAEGKVTPACCKYVHPGEEGNGRRIFPAKDGKPACVRLTGKAGFYERRRLKMSWQDWCKREGIAFTPNMPGERHEPVKRVPFYNKQMSPEPIPAEIIEKFLMLSASSPVTPASDTSFLRESEPPPLPMKKRRREANADMDDASAIHTWAQDFKKSLAEAAARMASRGVIIDQGVLVRPNANHFNTSDLRRSMSSPV